MGTGELAGEDSARGVFAESGPRARGFGGAVGENPRHCPHMTVWLRYLVRKGNGKQALAVFV